MTALTTDDVRLEDPEFYQGDRETMYARLQREAPAFYYHPLDIFVLSRLEDIKEAARTPEIFSSAHGLHLGELRLDPDERAVYKTLFGTEGEQFAYADPPRHRDLRSMASRSFAPKAIAYLGEQIEKHVAGMLGEIELGKPFDFIEQVGGPLPFRVAEDLIGLPRGHEAQIAAWSEALENLKLIRGAENLRKQIETFRTMNDFFRERIAYKRQHPAEDLISNLLEAQLDGEPVSEANLLIMCSTFLAAGSDNTRALLASMVRAFAMNPEQWDILRANPELLDNAVEESLRWATPARGFARTVMSDTEIAGTSIKQGQRVYLLFDAGNRDADAFESPWTFDIRRHEPRRQLSFGYGVHQCIAAHLARLEARIVLRRLVERYERLELAGEPEPIRQVLRSGWLDMPVTFH
ncbi:cytochrome P450 [Dactylosporangium sp. NPDC051485]|uniref:cytochrome P450 n=1 Tax=Dactylosporangium sp. NPDC051485 TaxID=3154846 RepID=UPI00342D4ADD